MSDTPEENTEWVRQWIVGGADNEAMYRQAVDIAETGDSDKLCDFLTRILREAPEDTPAFYTNRDMSDADMASVNWDEIRDSLLN